MSFPPAGGPHYVIPQLANQRPPNNIRFSAGVPTQNMPFPPPNAQNMNFITHPPPQPAIQPQNFYMDGRVVQQQVYYHPVPQDYMMPQTFTRPPPQVFPPNTEFMPQNPIDMLAKQLQSMQQPNGSHPGATPQTIPLMNHQVHRIPQMAGPFHHQQVYYHGQQTPTTTASHSGSKRSSPHHNVHSADNQQPIEDYTPPGTPQELTPITDNQSQQYISSSIGPNAERGMDMLVNDFNQTTLNDRHSADGNKLECNEYYSKKYSDFGPNQQNQQSQYNPQIQNQYIQNQPNQNPYNQNQQNQNQQRPRQMPEQWRGQQPQSQPVKLAQISSQQQLPPPQKPLPEPKQVVVECTYCRILDKPPEVYTTHTIRDLLTGKAICPEMKKLKCSICEKTGEDAHREYFCPENPDQKERNDLEKIAPQLKAFIEQRKNPSSSPSVVNQNNYQNDRPHYQPQQNPQPNQQQNQQQQSRNNNHYNRSGGNRR